MKIASAESRLATNDAGLTYGHSVPAVGRALAVIDRLRGTTTGMSLSALSRELGVSPSSMLAIMRTLQAAEYVVRDPETRRYRLGPMLGPLAKSRGGAEVSSVASAVSALAQASSSVGDSPRAGPAQREVLTALGQAARHLAWLLLEDGRVEVGPVEDGRVEDGRVERRRHGLERDENEGSAAPRGVVWGAAASGPLTAAELDHYLNGDCLATLSCVKDDGYPYGVPVWYQWEDARFWLVPRNRAEWARYVALNPRVSLAISEHQPPLRRVLVEGSMEAVDGPQAQEQAQRLVAAMARRYLGTRADAYLSSELAKARQLFCITPEKLVTWRGLAPHPRYEAAALASLGGLPPRPPGPGLALRPPGPASPAALGASPPRPPGRGVA